MTLRVPSRTACSQNLIRSSHSAFARSHHSTSNARFVQGFLFCVQRTSSPREAHRAAIAARGTPLSVQSPFRQSGARAGSRERSPICGRAETYFRSYLGASPGRRQASPRSGRAASCSKDENASFGKRSVFFERRLFFTRRFSAHPRRENFSETCSTLRNSCGSLRLVFVRVFAFL